MRRLMVTDITRFSTREKVCTAAIDVETGECLRPMPYFEFDWCVANNIHPGTILEGQFSRIPNSSSPHTEDFFYTRGSLSPHGKATSAQFKATLDRTLSSSISDGFGVLFTQNQKHIPIGTPPNLSIITIKVPPSVLRIRKDKFNSGKIKASFTDRSGHSFSFIPITDLGFYDYAMGHYRDGTLGHIETLIHFQEEVYLRIGLSRPYQTTDGRNGFWLQVNGIYSFPNYSDEIRVY